MERTNVRRGADRGSQKAGDRVLFADCVKNDIESGEFTALEVDGLKFEATSLIGYHKDRPLSDAAKDFVYLLNGSAQESRLAPKFAQARPFLEWPRL